MATQEQQPSEEQSVSGQIMGVITKGPDTWQVTVQPGDSQYSKNLWTKDQELVGQMMAMIGQQATFYCRVSHWNRQDGQAVRSLWIGGWTTGAQQGGMQQIGPTVAQQMPQQPPMVPQAPQPATFQAQPLPMPMAPQRPAPQPITQDVKEIRIMREAADKSASRVLAAMIATGLMSQDDLTPERLHGFMDAFAHRRLNFYENGSSFNADEIPFLWEDSYGRDPGVHVDPWRQ